MRSKIHWPVNFEAVVDPKFPNQILLEPQKDGVMLLDKELSLVDTWRALIDLKKKGKTRRYEI